jgi:CheY-like chemotaxis protein
LLTGRKLLLADDSLTIQKVVSLTFNDEAMEVLTVASGAEALEKLQESLPDIILADVFMPEPDGYQLCERIKSDARTRHLPVVLLVGTFEPFNEAEARRVGADEVLTKPFQSIRDLVNKVGGLLGGSDEKNSNAESARDEHRAEETTQDLSPFAADARAANPDTQAAETTSTKADPFSDFDMDDATIQSTPAATFDAHAAHHPSPALEINEEEQFSDRGETDEAFVLGDEEAPAQAAQTAHAAIATENSYPTSLNAATNAATEAAPVTASSASSASAFSAHAARAAEADDALLELGDIAPAHGGDAAALEADDFILDIGDEDSFEPVASAPAQYAASAEHAAAIAEVDMHFAEHAPVTEVPEAFAAPEAHTGAEASAQSHAPEESGLWASPATADTVAEVEPAPALSAEETNDREAPEISESPSLLFANEPAPGVLEPETSPEQEGESHAQHAPAWDGEPVAASIVAHAGSATVPLEAPGERQPSDPVAVDASAAAVASATASSNAASQESNQTSASASALSPEMLDEVVRRVVAHMSEQVVREIAWEVVPDLAERLIKQRLEEEKTRTTP